MCKANSLISSILFYEIVRYVVLKFLKLVFRPGFIRGSKSHEGLPLGFVRWTKATLPILILMTGKHLFLNMRQAEFFRIRPHKNCKQCWNKDCEQTNRYWNCSIKECKIVNLFWLENSGFKISNHRYSVFSTSLLFSKWKYG